MMPKCCEKCKKTDPQKCLYYRDCGYWKSWVHESWESIRKAADKIRATKKEFTEGG